VNTTIATFQITDFYEGGGKILKTKDGEVHTATIAKCFDYSVIVWKRKYTMSSTRLHDAISQKAVVFKLTAMWTWNLT